MKTEPPIDYHAAAAAYVRLGFDKDGKIIEGNIYDLIKQVVDAAMGDASTRKDEANAAIQSSSVSAGAATPSPANTSEIRDNATKNDAYLLGIMIDAYANDQLENQHDNIGCCRESMVSALKAIRPYLRATEPISSGEISDTESLEGAYTAAYEQAEFYKKKYYELNKQLKPVSGVVCAIALLKARFPKVLSPSYADACGNFCDREAKAVLDAAGVKYVD